LTAEQLATFRTLLHVYRWYMQKSIHVSNVHDLYAARDHAFAAFGVEQCVYGQERLWNALVRWWEPTR
jgi:hypothetical protein